MVGKGLAAHKHHPVLAIETVGGAIVVIAGDVGGLSLRLRQAGQRLLRRQAFEALAAMPTGGPVQPERHPLRVHRIDGARDLGRRLR